MRPKKLGLEDKPIVNLDPKTLNVTLTSFTLSMTRLDGTEYEISSVHNMFSSVARYLTENNYCANIENDPAFKLSR